MTQTVSTGITVKSALYTYIIGTAPSVTSLVNANTSIDAVGAGAISVPITITGLGFVTGATVGTFVSAYGKADAVTATVTSVTATTIKATVTIPAGDANLSDGYTVTNPNGGFVKVAAFTLGAALNITAGPTITSVTPTAVTASSTATYTLAGTGFETGAKVTSTSTNATCGTATLTASISLSVSCTVGLITSGISLVVTNPDGGSATIALTPPAVVAPPGLFSKGTVGYAVAGRTETILIKGGGFYGQPKLHSNAKGVVRAVVAADSGALMAARITVAANGATGWHTITITLANGKSCKVNYLTKK